MVTTLAGLHRQTALLQQQVRAIRQARDAAAAPPRTAVEMAADLGLTLDPWQASALSTDADQILLLASRQAGKSTTAGLMALHEAVYAPGSLTLVVSPSERQSKRLLRSVRRLYGGKLRSVAPPVSVGILSIELRNGSEIHALPGSEATIRGFSAVDLLIVDEAARVSDALYASIRPMLAVSNGRLVALSTPWGKQGWIYEAWEAPAGWHREKVTAEQCPRIAPAFLARELETIGRWMYRQEYGCEFLEPDDALFTYADIAAAISSDVAPLFDRRVFA